MFNAQEAAQRAGEPYVSTEHLLVGLVRDRENDASRVLRAISLAPEDVEIEISKHLPNDGQKKRTSDMTLTPRAKRVIDLAYDEARNLSNNYIGTEHLLLGLIREGDGLAGRVLDNMGASLEITRKAVMAVQKSKGQTATDSVKPASSNHDPAQTSQTPNFRALSSHSAVLTLARLTGTMTGDHLCVMLLCEDATTAQALTSFGGNTNAIVSMIRDRILQPKTAEDLAEGFISASELIPLAAAEAEACQQELHPLHFLLAAASSGKSVTAIALRAAGITYDKLKSYLLPDATEP